MEIRRDLFDVAKWPLTTAFNLGGFVLDATGLNDKPVRLFDEEPVSRAETALSTANHAIHKSKPDQELARFEVMRAANGVNDMRERNPDAAAKLGTKVIAAAFEAAIEFGEDTPEDKPAETNPEVKPLLPHIPTQRQPSD
jgi:hypothetical protein